MKKQIPILILLILGMVLILHIPIVSADLSDGLVAYYPFEGNAKDVSGNNNDGTEYGDLQYKMGIEGESASFNGIDNYISVPSNSTLNPIDQLSISFWIKVDEFTNKFSPLVYKGGPLQSGYKNREYTVWLENTGSLVVSSAGDNSSQQYTKACCAKQNYWTNFVCIIDRQNSRMKIYVDGALKAEVNDSYLSFNNNSDDLMFGWADEISPAFSPFKGRIDELRIYNRALTDEEVKHTYEKYSLANIQSSNIICESNFDSGLEGWTGYSPEISWRASGGNPGGYLRWSDLGAPSKPLTAPVKFLGDWSALDGVGSISYDQAIVSSGSTNGGVGRRSVGISGPGGVAAWVGPSTPVSCPGDPACGWTRFTIPLVETAWILQSGSWNDLLVNVTSLIIGPEFYSNVGGVAETSALDNVRIAGLSPDLVGNIIKTQVDYDFILGQSLQQEFSIQLINTSGLSQSATLEVINPHLDLSVSILQANPITLAAGETLNIPIDINAGSMPAGVYDDLLLKLTKGDGETVYSNLKITITEQGSPNLPDLSINSKDIQLADYTLGDSATFNAVVHNKGLSVASNVIVQFYEFGNLLGQTSLTEVAADGSEIASLTVPIDTSGGEHLIQVVINSSNTIAELDENNNEASQIVTWGAAAPVQGNMLVTGSLPTKVYTGTLFALSGRAMYDIYVNGVRYTNYAVKGGSVQITINDDAGNEWNYDGIHTDINGNIFKYLQAPAAVGTYHLFITATDKTVVGTQELVFQVVNRPVTPQPPPSPPIGYPGGTTGTWNNEPSSGTWVWTPTSGTVPQSDMRVFSENIHFSNSNPASNEKVTVFAEINYWAPRTDMVAENVPINFYVTYPGNPKEKIGSAIIPSLSVGSPDFGSRYVSTTWKNNQGEGIYLLEVEIDPSYQEQNMLNNAATRAIIVGNLESHQGGIEGQVTDSTGGVGNVVIELFDSNGTTSLGSRFTDDNGHYLFENIPVDNYQVRIVTPAGDQADAETKATQVIDQEISEVDFSLTQQAQQDTICGDLDHDGDVDGSDMNIFRGALRTSVGQPGFVQEADYDSDGDIDFSDYQLWYGCYKDFISQ